MAPARMNTITTGFDARSASRNGTWDAPTCGIAPGYLQANLIVLPSAYARDFELLCARNPVPCPLLAKSAAPGDFENFVSCIPGIANGKVASSFDVRTDAPRYNVYKDGKLLEEGVADVKDLWDAEDHVAFLLGCSYSFETALANSDLTPPHVLHDRNVAMYRSNIPLCPTGKFQGGTYVVSMRMYHTADVERVREITRPYITTHGEPVAWGWEGAKNIGVEDVRRVDWGDEPVLPNGQPVAEGSEDGFVPVFWGCGVTPQEAVMRAQVPGIVIGHAPGYMLVLDLKEEDVLSPSKM